MRGILIILGLLFSIFSYGQANNDTIRVIAKLVTPGQGSKIYVAKYKVIKAIKGTVTNDTIQVGYYFYNEPKNMSDTVLLNLTTYAGDTKTNNYYIFPNYDAVNGIEKVKLSYIDFDYWEGCETGKGECNPLTFTRDSVHEKWYLIMPCGGTQTDITFTASGQKSPIKQVSLGFPDCPPIFELTKVPDGKYFAYMLACGLGGQIEINLKTEKNK